MDKIFRYFPDLSARQKEQYAALRDLYGYWNERINVISRKDIDNLYEHHVLHSLGIAKVQPFKPECDILDVGTGGGFPGIPLAIMFPQTHFHLVDSIGKKIKVVEAVAEALGLANVKAEQIRAEQISGEYDFVVSRAVTDLPTFVTWVRGKISPSNYHELRNGILYLKGGDLSEETMPFAGSAKVFELSNYFDGEFFETKKVLYLPMKARAR
ncbi:MAG: 16S rRNA (guanine(527)-N(7))-methyltransferase RsmG [Bacteroidales bacterium]|nr:16S rRNA (guanine(527)-N(7))-methyltransferase RsmG [Bacteroidales bacterium]